jgi:hypothetical protein
VKVQGDYARDGFALIEGLVPREVCSALLNQLKTDIEAAGGSVEQLRTSSNLLKRDAAELYGHHYPPMLAFLWGLTPAIATVTGLDLLPTYDYLRLYREGDVCRVHSDRPSCEHSLSLTLDYSDGEAWPLEVGERAIPAPLARVDDDFGGAPYRSLSMQPGDAVLYNGVHRRHGRITPNPNAWSAHLFLHWIERDGAFADHAFDGKDTLARPVNFRFD